MLRFCGEPQLSNLSSASEWMTSFARNIIHVLTPFIHKKSLYLQQKLKNHCRASSKHINRNAGAHQNETYVSKCVGKLLLHGSLGQFIH